MPNDLTGVRRRPQLRPQSATWGFLCMLAFVGQLLYWWAPGLWQGVELIQALSADQALEPLGVALEAYNVGTSLFYTASATGLALAAVFVLRGSRTGRLVLTVTTVVLAATQFSSYAHWGFWPLIATAGAGLALLWLRPTSNWLSEVDALNSRQPLAEGSHRQH